MSSACLFILNDLLMCLPRLGQKGLSSVDLLKLVLQLLCPSLLESTLNRKEAYLLPFGCTFPESGKESPHFYNIQTPRAQLWRWLIFARYFDYITLEFPKNQLFWLSR
jgi:hypothetical protein